MGKEDKTLQGITELRAGLDERIAREFGDELADDAPLSQVLGEHEAPLTWFHDEIVFDGCDQHGVRVYVVVQDADSDSLDGVATILSDWRDAQRHPVPAMLVFVSWRDYDGAEGVRELAEEFYAAFEQVAAASARERASSERETR